MKRQDYLVELCPNCYNVIKSIPSPLSKYHCKNCGEEYPISRVISAIDETKVSDDFNFLEKLLEEPNTITKIRINRNQRNLFSR